jgi:hypothetical protein
MSLRPLRPAPRREETPDERKERRRFTWKVLLVTLSLQAVGGGVSAVVAPPRLAGVAPAPRVPHTSVDLHEHEHPPGRVKPTGT